MPRSQLVKIYYWVSALTPLEAFLAPVVVLFYLEYVGIDFATYSLFIAALFVLNAFLEVPLGMLSDFTGRRKALLCGNLFMAFGLLSIAIVPMKETLYFSAVFISFGGALASGNLDSIAYETFKDENEDNSKFSEFLAVISTVAISATAIASVIGGIVADIQLYLPMYIDIALILLKTSVGFILFIILWPNQKREEKSAILWSLSKSEFTEVFEIIFTRSFLVALTLGITTFVLLRTSLNFYQPILEDRGITGFQLGILFGTGIAFSAIISNILLRKIKIELNLRCGAMAFVIITLCAGVAFYIGKTSYIFVFLGFFLHQFLRVIIPAVTIAEMHSCIPKGHTRRTTIISVSFLFQAVIAAVAIWVAGYLAGHLFEYETVLVSLHLISLLIISWLLLYVFRGKKDD